MKTQCAATVFSVKNVDESLKFYIGVLGFAEEFRYGEYVGIAHGEVRIHLSQNHPNLRPLGSGSVYIFCDEVDEFYKEITSRGAKTTGEPKDLPYGMRDFQCDDPDGNQLFFGTESKAN